MIEEGLSDGQYLLLILEGEAVVENALIAGGDEMSVDTMVLGVVGQGSLIGEMSLTDAGPRSATCLKRVSDRLRWANKRLKTMTAINRSLHQELEALKNAGGQGRCEPMSGVGDLRHVHDD